MKINPQGGDKVVIDVGRTPMARVSSRADLVAAAAQRISASVAEIKIYRFVPEDPKPFNVDAYSVWEDLPARDDFPAIVAAASTDIDDNMRDFLAENVFLVSKDIGSSHWLDEDQLPLAIRLVFRGEGSGDA